MTQFNNDQWDYVRYLIKNHKRRYYRWFCNKKRFVMSLYEEQIGHKFDFNNPKTFTEYLNTYGLTPRELVLKIRLIMLHYQIKIKLENMYKKK